MTNQSTIDKLLEMRLSAMADSFLVQMNDPQMKDVPFEDRFGMLVDVEYTNRKNNSLKRLIKGAGFDQPEAHIAAIDYTSGRKLNRTLIERLASCEYITEHRNVFITGATGSGKTYLACALGMEACKQRFRTRYIRLPDLLVDLSIARGNGTIRKLLNQYKKYSLLILDEWLLFPLKETECRDLLEIMEARYKRASTILCSQFDVPGWRDKLSDPILADAICDRIVHDSYTVIIGGTESMRKRKGLTETESERRTRRVPAERT